VRGNAAGVRFSPIPHSQAGGLCRRFRIHRLRPSGNGCAAGRPLFRRMSGRLGSARAHSSSRQECTTESQRGLRPQLMHALCPAGAGRRNLPGVRRNQTLVVRRPPRGQRPSSPVLLSVFPVSPWCTIVGDPRLASGCEHRWPLAHARGSDRCTWSARSCRCPGVLVVHLRHAAPREGHDAQRIEYGRVRLIRLLLLIVPHFTCGARAGL